MQAYDIKIGFILQQLRVREAQPYRLHEDKRCCIPPSETSLCWPMACVALGITRWFKAQGKTLPLNNLPWRHVLFTKGGQR